MPYTALQSMLDPFCQPGLLNYWKSSFLTGLGDGAIDTMLAYCADRPTPLRHLAMEQMGGAVSRVDPEQTALPTATRPIIPLLEHVRRPRRR